MVKVNTFIRKGYLLAGVMMAANMLAVNEMKASANDDNNIKQNNFKEVIEVKEENKKTLFLENVLNFVLSWENTINLVGGVVFSCANNYLKWWDYNPGKYSRLGCFGWRSGRLIKDIFQIDINFNLGRGGFWLILGAYNLRKFFTAHNNDEAGYYAIPLYFSFLVADRVYKFFEKNYLAGSIALIGFFLLQGFVSMPLAIHISNFSIAVSLDSMLWAGIGKFLDKTEEKKQGTEVQNIEYINQND